MMLFWLNIDESMQWITANKWINDNGNFAVTNDQNCNDDLRFSKEKESKEMKRKAQRTVNVKGIV